MNRGSISRLTEEEIDSLRFNQFTPEEIAETIRNNVVLDYSFGNAGLLSHELQEEVRKLSEEELKARVKEAKKKSVLELALHITPACNSHCGICYTNSGGSQTNLDLLGLEQVRDVIDQSMNLGAKSLFIAGIGEPTLDGRLFEILHHAREKGMASYVFVNGTTLSNDEEAQKYWDVDAVELAEMFKETGAYVAPKLWTLDPKKFERMTGTKGKYQFVEVNGVTIPAVFDNLDRVDYPSDQIIANVAVTSENFSEVDDIVGFCLNRDYKIFMEEFVQIGRGRDKPHLNLSAEQATYLSQLNPHAEGKQKIHLVVSPEGYLGQCKALSHKKSEDNYLINPDGSVKDIFEMRHTLRDLLFVKYGCRGQCIQDSCCFD